MEEFKLSSRYKDVDTTAYPIDSSRVAIVSNSLYTRFITDEEGGKEILKGIDFEGGPMLSVGKEFFSKKIKSIQHAYLITLE